VYSRNLIQVELDNRSSFSRNREWTSINLVVHLLLNLISLSLSLFHSLSICWVYRYFFFLSALTKEYCVRVIDSIIGFKQKVCDTILWSKSFSKLYFFISICFQNQFTPLLVCEFHHLFQLVLELRFEGCSRSQFSKMESKQITFKEGVSPNWPPFLRESIFHFGKKEWKSLFNQIILVHEMLLLKDHLYRLKKSMVNWFLKNQMRWKMMRKEKCKMIKKLKTFLLLVYLLMNFPYKV